VNYGGAQGQCYVTLGMPGLAGRAFELRDLLGDAVYERQGDGLKGNGLYLDLPPPGTSGLRAPRALNLAYRSASRRGVGGARGGGNQEG
jgi:hypothetical protein